MIIRTEAIVLRSLAYGETSQIATLFTRDRGKVGVLAKGSRLPKSRFGSTLQPMSFVQVVMYVKPTRALQILSECTHIVPFNDISRNLNKISVGLRIVELVNALTREEESNPRLFNLVARMFERLNDEQVRFENLLPFFQLRLASLSGFSPDIDRDLVNQLPDQGGVLVLDTGSLLSESAAGQGLRASRAVLRAFAIFARADLDVVLRLSLDPEVYQNVLRLTTAYLRHHFPEDYPNRTEKVFTQFIEPAISTVENNF